MKREMSNQAKAAKAIRAELKTNFPGIKFFVRSRGFTGGDSVDIEWTDGPCTRDVEKITDKYQYGHFDGMYDIYENSNKRDDIPQAKYVLAQRSISKELKSEIKEYIVDYYAGWDANGDENQYSDSARCYLSQFIYRFTQDKSETEIKKAIADWRELRKAEKVERENAESEGNDRNDAVIKNKSIDDYTLEELAAKIEAMGYEVSIKPRTENKHMTTRFEVLEMV